MSGGPRWAVAACAALSLWLTLPAAQPALAVEPLGRLAPQAPLGADADGIWEAGIESGGYVLSNEANPSALKRIYLPATEGIGRREVAVDVAVEGDVTSHGGLLYGVDEDAGIYHLYMLEPGPKVTLYRVHGERLAQPFSVPLPPGRETRRLLIREDGDAASFLVDGREVATVTGRGIGSGGLGIAAWGLGSFRFGAFWLSALPPPTGGAAAGQEGARDGD